MTTSVAPLAVLRYDELPFGARLACYAYALHVGAAYGTPTKIPPS